MDDYLEKEYRDIFGAWKADPNPKTMSSLLSKTKPAIDRALAAHVGTKSPNLQSSAKRIAIKAFQSYDPSMAGLNTHLMNQLQGLKRAARKQTQIVSVPERVALDQTMIAEVENRLRDSLGRDPSSQETADNSGLSLKRLTHLRKFKQPLAEGTFTRQSDEESSGYTPGVSSINEAHDPWVDLVYEDMDPTNQRILELSLGLYGNKRHSNQQIAQKLRVTPGAISQRKSFIQKKLNEAAYYSPFN